MNIEEAKRKLHNMAYRDLQTKPYDLKLADVIQILNQIKLDQQKPVVPQFVADWIETVKSLGFDLYELLEGPADNSLEEWITNEDNQELIVKARLFGYTVEKEKLYTVEIPNPNRNSKGCAKFRLEKLGDKVYLVKRKSKDVYQNKDSQKLTESEIRKDFDWAWQFAKEVTDD